MNQALKHLISGGKGDQGRCERRSEVCVCVCGGGGCQGGCDRGNEVFCYRKFTQNIRGGGGEVGFRVGWGGGVRVDVFEEMKFLRKFTFFWGVEGAWGVRVDVNEEMKFLRKFTNEKFGGGGGGQVRVGGWGGQGGCERRTEVFEKIQK